MASMGDTRGMGELGVAWFALCWQAVAARVDVRQAASRAAVILRIMSAKVGLAAVVRTAYSTATTTVLQKLSPLPGPAA